MRRNCTSYLSVLNHICHDEQCVYYNAELQQSGSRVTEREYQEVLGLQSKLRRSRSWRAPDYVKTDTSAVTTTPIQRAYSYANLRKQISHS